jgi:Arm DNA-binding domain
VEAEKRNGAGIEKKLSLGAYPDLGLKDARDAREQARSALDKGADPAEKKQSDKRAAKINAENTFSAVAKAYIDKNRSDGKADATVTKREWFMGIVERALGNRPIADIQPYEILDAVRPFERAKNHGNTGADHQRCATLVPQPMAAGQMVGMDVGFEDPAQLELAPFNDAVQCLEAGVRDTGAPGFIIQHRIDDHRFAGVWIGNGIGPRVGSMVKKRSDVRAVHAYPQCHDISIC